MSSIDFESAGRSLLGINASPPADRPQRPLTGVHPLDRSKLDRLEQRLAAKGRGSVQVRWKPAEGDYARLRASLRLVRDAQGRAQAIVGRVTAVQPQPSRNAKSVTRPAQARRPEPAPPPTGPLQASVLRLLVESSRLPMGLCDTTGRLCCLNLPFVDLFGGDSTQFPSLDAWADHCVLNPESLRGRWPQTLHELTASGHAGAIRAVRVRTRAGEERQLQVRLHGVGPLVLVAFDDLTQVNRATADALPPTDPALAFTALYVSQPKYPFPLLHFSESVQTICGYSAERFLQDNAFWYEAIHPEDLEAVQASIVRLQRTGRSRLTHRWRHADGTYRSFFADSRILQSAEGEPLEMFGCLADVQAVGGEAAAASLCERQIHAYLARRAEAVVRDHHALTRDTQPLRLLVEHSPVPMGILRLDGTAEYHNPTFFATFGHAAEATRDVEGMVRLLAPDATTREEVLTFWHGTIAHCAAVGEPIPCRTWRMRSASGETRHVQIRTQVVQDRLLVVYDDVTTLKTVEARLERLAQHASSLLLELSPTGYVLFASRHAPQDPFPVDLGKTIAELGWPSNLQASFARTVAASAPWSTDHRWDRPGHGTRHYQASFNPVSEGGQLQCIVLTLTDITSEQRSQEAMAAQQRELARLGRLAAMGEVGAAYAHELAQPLSALVGDATAALGIARNCCDGQCANQEVLQDIVDSVQRLREVFNRLRNLIQPKRCVRELLNLNEVVQEALQLFRRDASASGIRLEVRLHPHLAPVWLDRVQLQQVLINLLNNALDAVATLAPHRRRIEVSTSPAPEGGVCLAVRDDGPGIAAHVLPDLFSRALTTKPHGTGIGLRLCHRVVEAHHGTLTAENHARQGATFCIHLPVGTAPST